VQVVNLRGSVQARLGALKEGRVDATLLALSGELLRSHVAQSIDVTVIYGWSLFGARAVARTLANRQRDSDAGMQGLGRPPLQPEHSL
jgi:porphobilinogen deaminase